MDITYIPYTTPLWLAARGSLQHEEAIKACREFSCCFASGMELKVFSSLGEVQGVEREVAEFSLKQTMSVLRGEYNKKGGCDNAEIERIFSLMALSYVGARSFLITDWVSFINLQR